MRVNQELFRPAKQINNPEDLTDKATLDVGLKILDGLASIPESNPVTETKIDHNRILLSNGFHGNFSTNADHTLILGLGADSQIGRVVTGFNLTLNNLVITSTEATLLELTEVITVTCNHCTFIKLNAYNEIHINMVDGARLILNDCKFYGGPVTGGAIIVNPGLITNAQLLGCVNYTGNIYGNITPLGSF